MDPDSFGRYRVRRMLGHGGFAKVYLCLDPELDAMVAVKVLSENFTNDEDIQTRFVQEARILRRLDSERILRVHTIDRLSDGRPYFVSDYADRGTLDGAIRAQSVEGSDSKITVEEGVILSRDLAHCLAVAHQQQIVHRDLKPSNILFRTDPRLGRKPDAAGSVPTMDEIVRGDARMVLADFGIARALEAASGHTISAGTPHYMAPEQADGIADVRSDLYAAAVILYQLLAGEVPFPDSSLVGLVRRQLTEGPPSIRVVRPDVPESGDVMLQKGMSIDPDERYQTADEWLRALDDTALDISGDSGPMVTIPAPAESESTVVADSAATIVDETPPPGPSGRPPEGEPATRSRRKGLLIGGGVAALVIVLVLGFLLLQGSAPDAPTGLMAATTPQGVQLDWGGPPEGAEIEGYTIYRDGEEIATTTGAVTTYLDSDADVGQTHEYTIDATGTNQKVSEISEAVGSAVLAAPNSPTGISASVGPDSIDVSWRPPQDVSNVTGYGVYRNGVLIATLPAAQTAYVDGDVDVGLSHQYSVDALATEEIRSAQSDIVVTSPYVVTVDIFEIVEGEISSPNQVDRFFFDGFEGEFITVFANSTAGLVQVEVLNPDGTQVAASEPSPEVALNFRPPQDGQFEALVSLADDATGSYSFSYSVLASVFVGESVVGSINQTSGFNEWTFFGVQGDSLAITLKPDTASPRLRLFGPDGSILEEFEGNPGSVIVIFNDIAADGDHVIEVSYTSGSGGYWMSINPQLELLPRTIVTGTLNGTLSEDFSESHFFEVAAGMNIIAFMTSFTGDPLLGLFDPADDLIELNDDFTPDVTTAQVSAIATVDGTYSLLASFDSGSGDYELTYDRDLPQGTVGDTDTNAEISFEGEVDVYTLEAVAGETLVIFMTSDNTTARWTLWDRDFNFLAENNAEGLIEYVVQEDTFFMIEASMISGTSPYRLIVTRFIPLGG